MSRSPGSPRQPETQREVWEMRLRQAEATLRVLLEQHPDERYRETVERLRELTNEIVARPTPNIGAQRGDSPETSARQLARREQEDTAIDALRELVKRHGEWDVIADAIRDAEAWWVYRVLMERAHGADGPPAV